ncbi:hypothetical protein Leryth_023104 [Lithospermum erythrorhizon]|nr:hypothetical protein Leryth_023104 [Lithospermum erythrorhizon]
MQMTSLHCTVPPLSQSMLMFHHPFIKPTFKLPIFSLNRSPSVASTHLDSHFATHRFKNGERLRVSSKLDKNVIFASSNNPPEGFDIVEKMENGTAKGPPFLTILAGLLVFAAVCWVLGSIVMWLIGLVINLSPK